MSPQKLQMYEDLEYLKTPGVVPVPFSSRM